jgi:hypothetical protein
MQVGREAEHRFAVAKRACAEGIAGGEEQLTPDGQMPPPRARVAQLAILPGSRSGTPTTQPR